MAQLRCFNGNQPTVTMKWLLRHTSDIDFISFRKLDDGGGSFTAHMKLSSITHFVALFPDYQEMVKWFDRPSLQKITLTYEDSYYNNSGRHRSWN